MSHPCDDLTDEALIKEVRDRGLDVEFDDPPCDRDLIDMVLERGLEYEFDHDFSTDLSEFDSGELIDELDSRGICVVDDVEDFELLRKMHVALYRGEPLDELVRKFLNSMGFTA